MTTRPTRRALLRNAAAAALAPALSGCASGDDHAIDEFNNDTDIGADTDSIPDTDTDGRSEPVTVLDPDGIFEDESTFPLAVQSGAMRTDRMLVCTWVDGLDTVRVLVWRDTEVAGEIVLDAEIEATPVDGYVKVDVVGLTAGTWYRYAFFEVDATGELLGRSLIGRVRTAIPDDSLEPVVFALSSCNGPGHHPWPSLQVTAIQDYDAFLHLGDMAYNDGAKTLTEYRESWRWYLQGDGFKKAFATTGLYATWDDHEVDNGFNPQTMDPEQLAAAKDAYLEVVALEERPDKRLWGSYRWGLTVEIFVLDCRGERQPSTRTSDDPIYVSRAQMDWLKDGLAHSPCTFKLVMNSVPITNMPSVWDFAAFDRWEGYAAQREELLNHIRDAELDDVWFVSGDFHVCFVSRVQPGATGVLRKTIEIACTGGHENFLGDLLPADQFTYGVGTARATLIRLDPATREVTVRFYNTDGSLDEEQVLSQ